MVAAAESDPYDVDEDGNPVRPRFALFRRDRDVPVKDTGGTIDRTLPPEDVPAKPDSAMVPAAAAAAAGPGGLFRPQPTQGASLAILAQHFDMPQEFATFLRQFDASFLDQDYLFSVDPRAYWKVKYGLDHLVDLIAGQVDVNHDLRVRMPAFLREYHAIDDAADDWEDEIHQKVFMLSKLVKVAGLGTKDAPKPLKVVPPEAVVLKIRKALEPWQVSPDEAGIVQVAERVEEWIRKRRLMIMVVDVDPYSGIAFGGGKSQLLFQLLYWSYELLDQVYDARKDCVYRQDRARFERMLRPSETLEVPIGLDEMNQFFDMWNWSEPKNQFLVHQIEMYRKTGRPVIGACGSIWILNKRFRELIVTHRLSVTKWDDENYQGEASLFQKWGPPAAQDEKENKWGKLELQLKFAGLKPKAFRFYSQIVAKTAEIEDRQSLDDYVSANRNWLADQVDPDELVSVRQVA